MNCSATLVNIASQCGKVLGGLKKFYVINRDKVDTITVSQGAITAITLTGSSAGDGFIEYGFKRGTANVTIAGNADDSGRNNSYTTTAHLEFMKQETAKRVALQALVETDAYAVWEDNNGKRWLMGYDQPIAANVNGESGSAFTDNNMYSVDIQDATLELNFEITMAESDWEDLLDSNMQ